MFLFLEKNGVSVFFFCHEKLSAEIEAKQAKTTSGKKSALNQHISRSIQRKDEKNQ
jgi:hypothetical protein